MIARMVANAAITAIEHLAGEILSYTQNALDTALRETVAEAQKNHTFKSQTGRLEKAIRFRRSGFVGTIKADTKYAAYVEYGNDPGGGYIYPKNGKFLRFRIAGRWVFARRVKAHGPMPFMAPALVHGTQFLQRALLDVVSTAARRFTSR